MFHYWHRILACHKIVRMDWICRTHGIKKKSKFNYLFSHNMWHFFIELDAICFFFWIQYKLQKIKFKIYLTLNDHLWIAHTRAFNKNVPLTVTKRQVTWNSIIMYLGKKRSNWNVEKNPLQFACFFPQTKGDCFDWWTFYFILFTFLFKILSILLLSLFGVHSLGLSK